MPPHTGSTEIFVDVALCISAREQDTCHHLLALLQHSPFKFSCGSFPWASLLYWLHYKHRETCRVSQNRIYTPYMTVYLVISLPKIPYMHRIYMYLWPFLEVCVPSVVHNYLTTHRSCPSASSWPYLLHYKHREICVSSVARPQLPHHTQIMSLCLIFAFVLVTLSTFLSIPIM